MAQKTLKHYFGGTAKQQPKVVELNEEQRLRNEDKSAVEQQEQGQQVLGKTKNTRSTSLPSLAETAIAIGPKSSKVASLSYSDIHIIPELNQPSSAFSFPATAGRKCQAGWFSKYQWLHYDSDQDAVFCHTCIRASSIVGERQEQNSLTGPWFKLAEKAFIVTGFRNWKKGSEKLVEHERSNFHGKNTGLIISREVATPVHSLLNTALQKEQSEARKCLLTIVSSLRFLMISGNSVRGHDHTEGNLMDLLEERQLDVPELKLWLKRRNNYLSADIQNELIEIMAHSVQRNIVNLVKNSPFFGIIADGTTDVHGLEQFSICFRYVDIPNLEANEVFIGMYNPEDSKGNTLACAIKDVLLRLNVSIEALRGHCFDGAANMSGRLKGAQKVLEDDQPKSMYVHCGNHSLDLALQEISRMRSGMCDLLMLVKDASNFIRDSFKRRKIYSDVVLPLVSGSTEMEIQNPHQLLPLCPTRWCVRVKSLKRFKEEYVRVKTTLETVLNNSDVATAEKRATVRGYLQKLNSFDTMFFLVAGIEIFGPCEELARVLQNPRITVAGLRHACGLLTNKIEQLRSDNEFKRIYEETCKTARDLQLEKPEEKMESRVRKVPRRLEQSNNPALPAKLSHEATLRKEYFEILDLLKSEIVRRFNQKGLHLLEQIECILIDAYQGNVPTEKNLKKKLGVLADDFDISELHVQLKLLKNLPDASPSCCVEIINQFRNLPESTKSLLRQVMQLIILLMTVPASAASSERSFSALRRLKTYLRATMSQKRLTHILLLHVHKNAARNLDLLGIMREFVVRKDERKTTFGKI